ncbi:16S rRNA (adenine(1518)-N(6)/adenine(1519)-N(6))-dimethyltransferase RsmA [Ectothiorhodospira marina]|uniref:Ribosomal RNA small subunit methyltransferase A n=1 Tax=Ectothiorhodospira marina TaxID=1396821 RepID=A0A1H7NNA7_9GAMM|nr:16S rRNA (adenine(1518)-N(6)/adenine(1519)-N(6))-dimethyltransferase RsmA [Ectothiorhodospira marina]SEL25040.1 16S rRNA (adenine1518-N6/adenine1519-N6)-dimethyltransferase [Ectothiorhodospira marina]
MNHAPRKRFGQHFLHDPGIIRRIVGAIAPHPDDTLVEIGPGLGAITGPLLERLHHLHVVELDRDLIPHLHGLGPPGTITVHAADALRFDLASIPGPRPLRVVGNLPYNISTPLIFHLLAQAAQIRDMHFLLQKEVVDRLTAGPGTAAYGRLGIMVQYRCRAEPLFPVGPGAFRPPPRVDSAVVRLTPYETLPYPARDEPLLARLVQQAFTRRRKTLRNALQGLALPEQIEAAGIDPTHRPETLSVEAFVRIADIVSDTAPASPPGH